MSWISPDYFQALETLLLAGRDLDQRDTPTSPRVAIVNQSPARALAKGGNPFGMSFQSPANPNPPEIIIQIVGLVEDTSIMVFVMKSSASLSFRSHRTPLPMISALS